MTKTLYFILFCINLQFSVSFRHQNYIPEKIWKEPCSKHSLILNDCNWCRCNPQKRYTCDARACSEVDMFGHFNDAIKELEVGMEGHGVWRTNVPACQPGVPYQRGTLLCICDEDGNWPNPTCRDTFRVLYHVELVTDVKTFKDQSCTPTKLYLIGCNVCICPHDGIPNPRYCTRKTCSKTDSIFNQPKERDEVTNDIYASCDVDKKYKLGCKNCVCLRNNRLLCDNCTEESVCSNREPGEVFNIECNLCQCDENGSLYCSVKRCLEGATETSNIIDDSKYSLVERPKDHINCIGGTKFKIGCRTCYCYQFQNTSLPYCNTEICPGEDVLRSDCVEKTIYEMDCLICHCMVANGKRMELCHRSPNCKRTVAERTLPELSSLRGYCEPLHIYRKDCNTCECLSDGKTVKCTAHVCQDEGHSVEVVPVVKEVGNCPIGRSYRIDCNVCFCLSNGDVLCTTASCRKIK